MNTKKLINVSIFYLTSNLLNILVCHCCIKSGIVVIKYNRFFLTVGNYWKHTKKNLFLKSIYEWLYLISLDIWYLRK